jgi:serine/threonine-protein kinase PpkA
MSQDIQIPGYRVLEKLGSGSMATVYLAVHELLERRVALKVMAPSLRVDRSFCERFVQEGRIVASLSHPHIVTVYDIGVADSLYFMAMELLERGSLKEHIREGIGEVDAVRITSALAEALHYAHGRGVVHRDVKPSNILFRSDGNPVLTDFGIAKNVQEGTQMTQIGWAIGTPDYMSPEQALSQPVDGRSDLYCLGIVFYEMLTGERPYKAGGSLGAALMHVGSPTPRLPEQLVDYQAVLDRLVAKKPEDRYETAMQLVDALRDLGAGQAAPEKTAAPPPLSAASRGASTRAPAIHTPILVAGAGSVILILGVLFWRMADWSEPSPPTPLPVPEVRKLDAATQAQIEQLLAVAEAHEEVGRLTAPSGSNAAENYLRVIQLDPSNANARAGQQRVADHYQKLAEEALAQGRDDTAREYIETGLRIVPDHASLLALKRGLQP